MYTAHIGKRFVEIYNRRTDNSLTAREFFEKVYFPLFFDDARYLQHIGNAPFAQLVNQKKHTDPKARKLKLTEVIGKISSFIKGEKKLPDMSFAVGATSSDMSLGQLTNMIPNYSEEDIYGSWIGSGLGLGVKSGDKANLEIIIDNEEIMWAVFEGWSEYRKYIDQTPIVKDKQIETWNAHWLNYKLSGSQTFFLPPTEKEKSKNSCSIPTITWVSLLVSLSVALPNYNFVAQVFGLGKQNTTVGFININLHEIKKPFELYQILFGSNILKPRELADIYDTQYGFLRACQDGTIGLIQLEPKDLKYEVKSLFYENKKGKKNKNIEFNLHIYKSWILAMLNNIQLNELAGSTAQALFDFFKRNTEGTANQREQLVREILQSKTRKSLIESMSKLLDKKPTSEQTEILTKVKYEAINNISVDNIGLFVALVAFDFKVLKNI
jgi:hypothetical protein